MKKYTLDKLVEVCGFESKRQFYSSVDGILSEHTWRKYFKDPKSVSENTKLDAERTISLLVDRMGIFIEKTETGYSVTFKKAFGGMSFDMAGSNQVEIFIGMALAYFWNR